MKRLLSALIGAALVAAFSYPAFGQVANKDTVWATPGNNQVTGAVTLCANASGIAVPCTNGTGSAGYPAGATPLYSAITGTTAGVVGGLGNVVGKTTYLCGFSVSPGSATTAITILVTVTGLNQTLTWAIGAPATAAGTTGLTLTQTFNPCIPAPAVNSGINVIAGALGAGGINQAVNSWGYAY